MQRLNPLLDWVIDVGQRCASTHTGCCSGVKMKSCSSKLRTSSWLLGASFLKRPDIFIHALFSKLLTSSGKLFPGASSLSWSLCYLYTTVRYMFPALAFWVSQPLQNALGCRLWFRPFCASLNSEGSLMWHKKLVGIMKILIEWDETTGWYPDALSSGTDDHFGHQHFPL